MMDAYMRSGRGRGIRKLCMWITCVLLLVHFIIMYQHTTQTRTHVISHTRHVTSRDANEAMRLPPHYPSNVTGALCSHVKEVKHLHPPHPNNVTGALCTSSQSSLANSSSFSAAACTQPQHNIYFLKMYKSASSTLQTMIQTFALRNDLIQMNLEPQHPFPDPDFRLYINGSANANVLSEHTVLCEICIQQTLPGDTKYITLIREPFSRLTSLFSYFNLHTVYNITQKNAFEYFLQNIRQLDTPQLRHFNDIKPKQRGYSFRYGKEMLATQFGYLEREPIRDFDGWMEYLDSRFLLVGIVERMHESIVLLRRALCWTIKDMLYVTLRQTRKSGKVTGRMRVNSATEQKQVHQLYSPIDYQIYDYFSAKFQQTIAAQPADFSEEVLHLKSALTTTQTFCQSLCKEIRKEQRKGKKCNFSALESKFRGKSVAIAASPWSERIRVTGVDCLLMMLNHDKVRQIMSVPWADKKGGGMYGRIPWQTFCNQGALLACS